MTVVGDDAEVAVHARLGGVQDVVDERVEEVHGRLVDMEVAVGEAGEELVTVAPEEGELAAGQEVKIVLTFKAAAREVRLRETKILMLSVMDTKSGKVVDQTLVTATAETQFSKFNFTPSKGLNFGALRYGQEKERKLEIKNLGAFAFTFNVELLGSPADKKLLEITEGRQVAGKPPHAARSLLNVRRRARHVGRR